MQLFMELYKKPNKVVLLLTTALLAVTLTLIFQAISTRSDTSIEGHLHSVLDEQFENQAKLLRDEVNKLDEQLIVYRTRLVDINAELEDINKKTEILTKTKNEKIASVDSFTISELQQFFTDRYEITGTGKSSSK
jgi:septal ring factor EnvC (AmiA/AmiB activator)